MYKESDSKSVVKFVVFIVPEILLLFIEEEENVNVILNFLDISLQISRIGVLSKTNLSFIQSGYSL